MWCGYVWLTVLKWLICCFMLLVMEDRSYQIYFCWFTDRSWSCSVFSAVLKGKPPTHLWHSVRTGQLIWIHFDIHAFALVTEMQAKSCHSGWLQLPKKHRKTCYTTFIHENVDTCPSKFTQFHLAFMIKVPIISPFQCFKLHFLGGFRPLFVAQQRSPRRSGSPQPWAARCDWSPEKRWVNSAWPLGLVSGEWGYAPVKKGTTIGQLQYIYINK